MTRFGWTMVGCALLLIVIVFAAFRLSVHQHNTPVATDMATTTPLNPNTVSIYTNGQYGFSVFYLAADTIQTTFASTSNAAWRVNSTANGTPIAWVIDQAGQVRVGASNDQRALKVCQQVGPAESPLGRVAIASTTWGAYRFDQLGTENEVRVTSYRTMHDGACVVLEAVEPLAQAQAAGTTSPVLERIVQSFQFARP